MSYLLRILRLSALGFAGCIFLVGLLTISPVAAQTKPAPKATPKKPAAKKPLTKEEVQNLWKQGIDEDFMHAVQIRHLAFEPEEIWVNDLPKVTGVPRSTVPSAAGALDALIPPAPDVDAVASAAPDLLDRLKEAAQKRSEPNITPLVHPELLVDKGRVYDLFDTANYSKHSLGHFAKEDNRRVGVQFFQLTNSHVERLHYVLFSMYGGKIVVRDIVTGPEVTALFLKDEQQVAISKLNLVFRALNEGDDAGLRTLCTPGLFDSLKTLADDGGGSRILVGHYQDLSKIEMKPSASLDSKSIRVVVRVSYHTRKNKEIAYDVDFERIKNDLKVVRIRDLQGGVIAWDPNIDNYLNERYGLPDGPPLDASVVNPSIIIVSLPSLHESVIREIQERNAPRLKEYADEFLDSENPGGEGYGIQAASEFVQGKYDEAAKDAALAIDRGGSAYFTISVRSNGISGQQFTNKIVVISKTKIEFKPFVGQAGNDENLATSSVQAPQFNKKNFFAKAGPFVDLVSANGKYTLAAFGTTCPADVKTAARPGLVQFQGGGGCTPPVSTVPVAGQKQKCVLGVCVPIGLPHGPANNNNAVPVMVPGPWQQELQVVVGAIDHALGVAS